jgi:23S rRNA pseudouridine1911/1915/1917 synthase
VKRKPSKKRKGAPKDLSRALEELTWDVEETDHKGRLDRFLAERLPWRSRTSIVELLSEGQVKCDGEVVCKKSFRLRAGTRVAVAVPPPEEPERHAELAEALEGAILFEDEHLLALAKPAGLVVHPVGRLRVNTLIQVLHWRFRFGRGKGEEVFGGSAPGEVGPVVPRVCHRLDRDTSGVIVFAKNAAARTAIQLMIEGDPRGLGEVRKDYLACVHGAPDPPAGRVDACLGPDPQGAKELQMTLVPGGLLASTTYSLEARSGPFSWVGFRIHTGRQHQIRVHAAQALGCPVLCDTLYGRGESAWPPDAPVIERQALHARRLRMPHPKTGAPLVIEADLPPDLAALRDLID